MFEYNHTVTTHLRSCCHTCSSTCPEKLDKHAIRAQLIYKYKQLTFKWPASKLVLVIAL